MASLADLVKAHVLDQWAHLSASRIRELRTLWDELSSQPTEWTSLEEGISKQFNLLEVSLSASSRKLLREVLDQYRVATPAAPESGPPPSYTAGVASNSSGELTATVLSTSLQILEIVESDDPKKLADHLAASGVIHVAIDEAITAPRKGESRRYVDGQLRLAGLSSRRPSAVQKRFLATDRLVKSLTRCGLRRVRTPSASMAGHFETSTSTLTRQIAGRPGVSAKHMRMEVVESLGIGGFSSYTSESFRSALAAWIAVLAATDRIVGYGRFGSGWVFVPDHIHVSAPTPDFVHGLFPLPDELLPKGRRYARWLRRELLRFWYATMEGQESSEISAAAFCVAVNTLDEAVFEDHFGSAYSTLRGADAQGLVVEGLELIRNCEVHSSIVDPNLFSPEGMIGVPFAATQRFRRRW